jgi:hypothetical protein
MKNIIIKSVLLGSIVVIAAFCLVPELHQLTSSLEHLTGALTTEPDPLACLDIDPSIKHEPKCLYNAPAMAAAHQPLITKFCWDNVTLRDSTGKVHQFGSDVGTKGDIILWKDGFKSWNWKLDGTSHNPGITGKAFNDLLSLGNKPNIVILTRGVQGVLQTDNPDLDNAIGKLPQYAETELETAQDIKDFLAQPIAMLTIVRSLKSFDAVVLYNALVNQGKNVAMLLHTTC